MWSGSHPGATPISNATDAHWANWGAQPQR
jgi:hypothetical protein